jgi:hypothetical protein
MWVTKLYGHMGDTHESADGPVATTTRARAFRNPISKERRSTLPLNHLPRRDLFRHAQEAGLPEPMLEWFGS